MKPDPLGGSLFSYISNLSRAGWQYWSFPSSLILFPNHLYLYPFFSPFSYKAYTYLFTPLLKQPPGYSSTCIKRSVVHVFSTPSFTSPLSSLLCISHPHPHLYVTVSQNCPAKNYLSLTSGFHVPCDQCDIQVHGQCFPSLSVSSQLPFLPYSSRVHQIPVCAPQRSDTVGLRWGPEI